MVSQDDQGKGYRCLRMTGGKALWSREGQKAGAFPETSIPADVPGAGSHEKGENGEGFPHRALPAPALYRRWGSFVRKKGGIMAVTFPNVKI